MIPKFIKKTYTGVSVDPDTGKVFFRKDFKTQIQDYPEERDEEIKDLLYRTQVWWNMKMFVGGELDSRWNRLYEGIVANLTDEQKADLETLLKEAKVLATRKYNEGVNQLNQELEDAEYTWNRMRDHLNLTQSNK